MKAGKVVVEVQRVYGRPTVYPISAAAQEFARLTGTKTLTNQTLASAARLGFEIEVEGSGQDVRDLRGWLDSLTLARSAVAQAEGKA